jgi:steroid delta-isomerase-like uncharacterized protein
MSTEQNKAIVRRFFDEVINKQNLAAIDELFAEHYVNHFNPPGMPSGREGERMLTQMFFGPFPDSHMAVEDLLAEGDKVAVRTTYTGTHQGEFMGIPATGKQVSIPVINIFRLENGQIVENTPRLDMLGLMQQLGAIPA